MSDIWSMLGIEPTDDKKSIRKAFAAQSRLHHPEEEPEYFAALNQAYKSALDYVALDHFIPDSKTEIAAEERESREPEDQENRRLKEQENPSSLLKRLNEASEQFIKKSMETGALHDFITLFENPRQAKQPDTWRRFFLSEAFLREQFSQEFGKGLYTYLSEQTLCPSDNLFMSLLQEMAIAYAFIPHFAGEEYFEGLKYPKEWYKVSVENTFPGRRYAAEIFNMQGRECDLKSMTNHIMRQPANKVRHNAFSDYLAIKEMSRDGRLTEGEKENWQQILGACHVSYLYERNGKQRSVGYYESRSECVVKLYVQWLKSEQLPREVLLFLYRKLDFKGLERSSTKGLYGALKEQVLRQCPQAEEILFGEEGVEQRIVKLYKTYSSILNAHQTNYDKFIYGETPEIRERAEAFFALPDWEALKGEKGLFERIYSTSKRIIMPGTVAKTLIGYLGEGDFPEPERTELTDSLLRSLSIEKMLRELDYRYEISLSSAEPGDIGDNPDFWQYFLMRGFGFRHARVRGSWEKDYIYVVDGQCYLPDYINYIYAPSRAWQRRFVGFDEEKEEIRNPVSVSCTMPGDRELRVEFHYHYCLYFVDGMQVTDPVLTFSELREYAETLEKPEEFFFLLAVTAIEEPDRDKALEVVEEWLGRIPVHPFIIPTIARLLAADNDRIPMALPEPGEVFCGGQHAAFSDRMTENRAAGAGTEAVLYSEQERFCFRALVSENGVSIWRQMDYGWQDTIFRSAEPGWRKWDEFTWEEYCPTSVRQLRTEECASDSKVAAGNARDSYVLRGCRETPEDRKAAALEVLHNLRQPRPRVHATYSLEGMDIVQKSAKILEAMGCLENMEGYCVLRYGPQKEKRHDRVFYGVCAPFGFDLKTHSMAYVRSQEYLMSASNTKIKEPKRVAGRFGWGFKYSPSSDYGPMYVYQGESGTFYAYGAVRMYRADSLEKLLADFFQKEWEGVTELETYEGCLTVSRLDHRLEYCYTEEDMRKSMGSAEDTPADRFTVFGGYGMWMEFVRWMDEALAPGLPVWVNAIVAGLDWERGGALTFAGIHEDDEDAESAEMWEKADMEFEDAEEEDWNTAEDEADRTGESDDSLQSKTYLPEAPLLVWGKGMDRRDRAEFLASAMQWYVDCGKFAGNTGGRNIRILINGF